MKVKRIFAPDMRQAMRRVREEIGPDAVIISNHRVAGGVEVVAAREDEYEAAQAELKRNRAAAAKPGGSNREEQVRILTGGHSHQSEQASRNAALEAELNKTRARIAEASRRMTEPTPAADRNANRQIDDEDDEDLRSILESLRSRNRRRELEEQRPPARPPAREPAPLPMDEPPHQDTASIGDDSLLQSMQHEIQELRSLLQQNAQPTPAPPQNPVYSSQPDTAGADNLVVRRLQQLGLGQALVRQLMSGVEPDLSPDKAWRNALSRLSDALPVLGEEMIERGGMIAFVGPTGVGKTTTIGKLAARHVLQHGSSSLALVTTDCFRIAAHEQLKTFGRILDVPVRVVDESHSLEEVLQSLRNKRLVLIDTAGMNASDPQGQLQMQMLSGVTLRLKKLLVLSCSSQQQLMRSAYDNYSTLGLHGCVLSKTDESGSLGEALTLAVEKQLPVTYITDGQKIPDDIGIASRNDLVSRAVVTAQKASGHSDDGAASLFRAG